MPHIVVKLYTGRSEAQKQQIAEEMTLAIMRSAKCGEDSVSVAIEDVAPQDWDAEVFMPEIAAKSDTLYKKPGYRDL